MAADTTTAQSLTEPSLADRQVLKDWLIRQGIIGVVQTQVLSEYCQRLADLGLSLYRVHVAQSGFHPRYGGLGFDWTRDAGVSDERYDFTETPQEQWLRSPFYHMLQSGLEEFRVRLSTDDADPRFPLLTDLRGRGCTDYFACALILEPQEDGAVIDPDRPPEGLMISWTADGPAGFSDGQIDTLRSTLPALGLALKSASNRLMAQQLLRVYLGRDAGRRVLSGELQRGSLRQIRAVMCFFDLVGFTEMAERIPGQDMISMLNDYFGITVAEIQNNGGHILKFMGDGLVAMFGHDDMTAAADAALDTVVKLGGDLAAHNVERAASGLPATDPNFALHAGEILYGNIGADNRLDFTVIGPAVNLTARLSGMHRALGQDVILSDEVQRLATPGRHDLVSLGRYMLRGVAEPRELFTIYQKA